MTAKEMAQAIGQNITIRSGIDGIIIQARVLDAKERWGMPRLLVTPIAGRGEAWVDVTRVVTAAPGANATGREVVAPWTS